MLSSQIGPLNTGLYLIPAFRRTLMYYLRILVYLVIYDSG